MAEKKYVIDNAELMAEWNWEKNDKLGFDPKTLTLGSDKKVWWVCEKCKHKYLASPKKKVINDLRRMSSCTYCKGLRRKKRRYM